MIKKGLPKVIHNNNIKHGMWTKYERGEISIKEYNDFNARKDGFKDWNEKRKTLPYYKEHFIPLNKREDCSAYLGVYIAENILPYIIENTERMPYGHEGYDAICKKGKTIDVKSSCFIHCESNRTTQFNFHIEKNKASDYFLCIGFDNRENLNVLYIWLIKGDEIIRGRKLNEFATLSISKKSLKDFNRYEVINKLDRVRSEIEKIKKNNNIQSCKATENIRE